MDWLCPISTGRTFFDVWSLVHFAFWFTAGSGMWSASFIPRPAHMVLALAVSYGWEFFERFAEKKWPTVWLNPESALNSYVSDPLMCVLGVLCIWYALDHWRF